MGQREHDLADLRKKKWNALKRCCMCQRGAHTGCREPCFVADTLQETGVVGTSYLSSGRGEPRIGLAASVLQNDNP